MPPVLGYPEALELTARTIRLRARRYRILAVGIAAISIASIGWAAFAGRWWPLLCLLFVFPACAIFFHADETLVSRWRHPIVDWWAEGRLDLKAFRSALEGVPSIPANTLTGMLQTIPNLDEDGGQRSLATRRALALTVRSVHACAADRRVITTLAPLGAAGFAMWALLQASLRPLVGLAAVALVFVVAKVLASRRLRRWRSRLHALQRDGLDLAQFAVAARQIDWRGVSSVCRDQFLDGLTG